MTGKIDWYDGFVELNYTPAKDDLICLYYFEPAKGISAKEAIGRIASESSAGTWTTLHELPARVAKIKARAFELNGRYVKVAYPLDLWEPGNAPQLSGLCELCGEKRHKYITFLILNYGADASDTMQQICGS